jgi:hypothetical protein
MPSLSIADAGILGSCFTTTKGHSSAISLIDSNLLMDIHRFRCSTCNQAVVHLHVPHTQSQQTEQFDLDKGDGSEEGRHAQATERESPYLVNLLFLASGHAWIVFRLESDGQSLRNILTSQALWRDFQN